MMADVKKCYLCGNSKFVQRPGSVRDKPDLKIFECTFCGLVFLSSFEHIRDGFYESSGMHGEEMPDIQAWLRETAWDDERRFQYFKLMLPNRKLLDFGCGAGGFLLKAKNLAKNVHGIESERRLKGHFKKHDITVFQNLSDVPKDVCEKGYDIITMFHVLEHLSDPKSVLNELRKTLTDNGQIIIEVPNATDALLSLYKNKSFANFTYWSCHLFLYTMKTLQTLFNQIKLKINYIKQIQRYPLSNHLYWLAKGEPDGHKKWHFFDSSELHNAYEKQLAAIEKCDTIVASISNR